MAAARAAGSQPLYTPAERARRDRTRWTLVQGVLAPLQFAIFAVSLVLVVRALATGQGQALAAASVVVKTVALYAIMVTGCLWEKAVFGRYLFAPAFYWEDVFSMLVLALHTAYLAALSTGWLGARGQMLVLALHTAYLVAWASGALGERGLMLLALAAYATYAINAGQFVLKLRAARRQAGAGVAASTALELAS